jgi:predicted DNA binding CopG/RHH family protein
MTADPRYETDVLEAYEAGRLKSVATKGELTKLRTAARATAIKDRRINIRLSTGDLQDIQVRALAEGVPYQTLISSVLHKYVTGRLAERDAASAAPAGKAAQAKRMPARRKGTA